MSNAPAITYIPRTSILPGPNPRTHFDDQKIEELRASMRTRGFDPAFPILVRPKVDHDATVYEIAFGETRWRAATLQNIAEIPCIVREMTTCEMIEIAMVENLQRGDMNALEEAAGYRMLLHEKNPDGTQVHTLETIARRIGKSRQHVSMRIRLACLVGSPIAKALIDGQITTSHAELLARVPAADLRVELLRKVLQPPYGPGPMAVKALEQLIQLDYQVELRGARFPLDDEELVPVELDGDGQRVRGGACGTCPHNTKNADPDAKGSRLHLCCNPECFRAKGAAAYERWRAEVTDEAERRVALPASENAALFDETGERLRVDTKYVNLAEKPGVDELKADVTEAPVWKALLKGQSVPVILARDVRGKVLELVDHATALAAAKLNKKEIFREKGSRKAEAAPDRPVPTDETVESSLPKRESEEDAKQRLLEAASEAERVCRTQLGILTELHNTIAKAKVVDDRYWGLLCGPLVEACEYFGTLQPVAQVLGYDRKVHGGKAEELREFMIDSIEGIPAQRLPALAMLLVRGLVSEEELPAWEKEVLREYQVNPKEIAKKVAAAMKDEAKEREREEEIANGMQWSGDRKQADEFNWQNGLAVNPETCTLALPAKVEAYVDVALDEKGWRVGWRVGTPGKPAIVTVPVEATATNYGNRALALACGLKAIRSIVTTDARVALKVKGWAEADQRLQTYLEQIEAPEARPKKETAKAAKEAVKPKAAKAKSKPEIGNGQQCRACAAAAVLKSELPGIGEVDLCRDCATWESGVIAAHIKAGATGKVDGSIQPEGIGAKKGGGKK